MTEEHTQQNMKTKSDIVNEPDAFDFFKPADNSLKFKHFLTPTIESNMLKYIASKSNDRNIVAKNTIHLVTV